MQVVRGFLFLAIDEESRISGVVGDQAAVLVSGRAKTLAGCADDSVVCIADDGFIRTRESARDRPHDLIFAVSNIFLL